MSMTSARLCHICRNFQLNTALERLDDGDLEDVYRLSHAEFFKCASSCDICEVTARYFLQKTAETDYEVSEEATIIVSVRKHDKNRRLIFFYTPGWHMVNWMVWSSTDALIDPNPLSDKQLGRLRSWILECKENHHQCKKPEPDYMPTRVLDVGVSPSSPVRVLLSADLEEEGCYVALSHCWGKSKPLITSSSNLSEFQFQIPYHSLPQTFADAVKLTRLLGIRYLWIDSLCIIQDDSEDWLRESATMASVYSNADITISASRASSSTEGFLLSRDETRVIKKEIDPSGQETTLYLVNRDYYEDSSARAADSHPEPLAERAWVIQERHLSRRKLLFGTAQTFWECREMTKSEDTQLTTGNGNNSYPISPWYDIIEKFTACNITYESDTLPAISGVARTVAHMTGHTYCAGIWLNQLANSLLWYPRRNGPIRFKKVERDTYVAPSFSWAGSRGPIWYRALSKGIMSGSYGLYNYIDHSQTLRRGSSDPYGAIEDAWIKLKAPLIRVLRFTEGIGDDVDVVVRMHSGIKYVIPATFDHEETSFPTDAFVVLLYADESRIQTLVLVRVSVHDSGMVLKRIGVSWAPFEYIRKLNWWGNAIEMDYREKEKELERLVQQAKMQMETVLLV